METVRHRLRVFKRPRVILMIYFIITKLCSRSSTPNPPRLYARACPSQTVSKEAACIKPPSGVHIALFHLPVQLPEYPENKLKLRERDKLLYLNSMHTQLR